MAYYNTTREKGQTLADYLKSNAKQDDKVLEMAVYLKTFSASKIFWYFNESCPITSIRRSLNTLKKKSLIEETGNKVKGLYGRNELEYKLV